MIKSFTLSLIKHSPVLLLCIAISFEAAFVVEFFHGDLPPSRVNDVFVAANIILGAMGTGLLLFAHKRVKIISYYLAASSLMWFLRGLALILILQTQFVLAPAVWILLGVLMGGYAAFIYHYIPDQVLKLFELNKRVEGLILSIQTKVGDL